MTLSSTRAPLLRVACGSLFVLLAFLAVVLQPLPLLAAAATAVLGAALVLTGPWRRFHAAASAAREAVVGGSPPMAAIRLVAVLGDPAPTLTRAPTGPVPVTLALQGGGSLGAFTWGVLDRLLDEPAIRVGAVSGASAGAMNAAMLAQGLATGGPDEAKRLLEAFWRRVSVAAGSPDAAWGGWLAPFAGLAAPVADALRQAARGLPRTQINPLGLNPLRGVLDGLLDPSAFGKPGAPTLVVSATRVRTGEARLFRDAEVTAEALLASACLPQLFPAVEIDGEAYWDGGYASNPPMRALVEAGAPSDIMLVRTTPVERPDPPAGASGVLEGCPSRCWGVGSGVARPEPVGSGC